MTIMLIELDYTDFRHFGLHAHQAGIDAVEGDEFVVCADLCEFTFVDDEQAVCVFECR